MESSNKNYNEIHSKKEQIKLYDSLIKTLLKDRELEKAYKIAIEKHRITNTYSDLETIVELKKHIDLAEIYINNYLDEKNYKAAAAVALNNGLYSSFRRINDEAKQFYFNNSMAEFKKYSRLVRKLIERNNISFLDID